MKVLIHLFFCLVIFNQSCNGQSPAKQEIFNKDFNWTITIPDGFKPVSAKDWASMQNKGADAIEKTFDEEVVTRPEIIFVFRNDLFNYFESNYQPFDSAIDGDYIASCQYVNYIMYETFQTQMPGVKIDSASSVEKIDNLDFQTFKMKIEYPNKMVMHVLMYSYLFDDKDFSVNIMYVDEKKGEQMLKAWKESKFSK